MPQHSSLAVALLAAWPGRLPPGPSGPHLQLRLQGVQLAQPRLQLTLPLPRLGSPLVALPAPGERREQGKRGV